LKLAEVHAEPEGLTDALITFSVRIDVPDKVVHFHAEGGGFTPAIARKTSPLRGEAQGENSFALGGAGKILMVCGVCQWQERSEHSGTPGCSCPSPVEKLDSCTCSLAASPIMCGLLTLATPI